MDSISNHLPNHNLIREGINAFLEEITQTLKLERECLVASNGQGLELLARQKNQMLLKLREVLISGYQLDDNMKSKLRTIHLENQANMKLFQSVLRLISGYKKLLKDTPLESGTYTNKGTFHRQEVSLRFNGTV